MKTEKRQFGNRMGAAVLLLALVCANGYAQEENKSSNNIWLSSPTLQEPHRIPITSSL